MIAPYSPGDATWVVAGLRNRRYLRVEQRQLRNKLLLYSDRQEIVRLRREEIQYKEPSGYDGVIEECQKHGWNCSTILKS